MKEYFPVDTMVARMEEALVLEVGAVQAEVRGLGSASGGVVALQAPMVASP